MSGNRRRWIGVVARFGIVATAIVFTGPSRPETTADAGPVGIHKIKHVVIVMQENRSFDHYFGTYPGADGIPMTNGVPTVCAPNPQTGVCQQPYVTHTDGSISGPHGHTAFVTDVAGGRMNGFIAALQNLQPCLHLTDPECSLKTATIRAGADVMSYHTGSDIPNYWAYADNFVLHDRMFAATSSWSESEHLFQVSGWSAYCPSHRPLSCRNELANPAQDHKVNGKVVHPVFAWTDMTYLLKKHGVSWNYFVVKGTEPDCADDQALSCAPIEQDPDTPSIWNPLPNFDTVKANRQVRNVQSVENFYAKAKAGKLPAVSWLAPSLDVSEHSPGLVSSGQSYVTSVINAVMRSPNWSSTAILVKWDDWGGFYDHVVPPRADINGYGIRVPSLVISPYAKQGFVDHQTLSFDAYNKFIEDVFLGGERLDPKTDGRPDRRPNVREDDAMLGNLAKDFDFNQPPRPPMLLPVHPITTLK